MALRSQRFAPLADLQQAAQNKPPLRFGSKGKAVEVVQATLVELGFPMPISTRNKAIRGDGIYGQETQSTVRAFQLAQGLSADGIAGRDTLHRLDEIQARREEAAALRERMFDQTVNLWT